MDDIGNFMIDYVESNCYPGSYKDSTTISNLDVRYGAYKIDNQWYAFWIPGLIEFRIIGKNCLDIHKIGEPASYFFLKKDLKIKKNHDLFYG